MHGERRTCACVSSRLKSRASFAFQKGMRRRAESEIINGGSRSNALRGAIFDPHPWTLSGPHSELIASQCHKARLSQSWRKLGALAKFCGPNPSSITKRPKWSKQPTLLRRFSSCNTLWRRYEGPVTRSSPKSLNVGADALVRSARVNQLAAKAWTVQISAASRLPRAPRDLKFSDSGARDHRPRP